MHKSQRVIFGNMGGGSQQQPNTGLSNDPTYLHNTLVLEMSNNWPYVRTLMDKFRNEKIKTVDTLERDWLSFILNNSIDIEKYQKDSDQFVEDWFKIIKVDGK